MIIVFLFVITTVKLFEQLWLGLFEPKSHWHFYNDVDDIKIIQCHHYLCQYHSFICLLFFFNIIVLFFIRLPRNGIKVCCSGYIINKTSGKCDSTYIQCNRFYIYLCISTVSYGFKYDDFWNHSFSTLHLFL